MASASGAIPTANLFGDDSSSSDESVGGGAAAAAPPPAPAAAEEGGAEPMEVAAAAAEEDREANAASEEKEATATSSAADAGAASPSGGDAGGGDASGGGGGGGGDEGEAAAPVKDNKALFGDDDSDDSDDAEFDGNDGIVGRKAPEGSAPPAPKQTAVPDHKALFGDDSDDDEQAEGAAAGGGEGGTMDDGGDEEEIVTLPPVKMQIPDLPRPDKDHPNLSLHVTKLPNIVGINPTAYDPDTHDPTAEDQEYGGMVHNMIRWRYRRNPNTDELIRDPESGRLQRESNARLVKWSDGSFTLHVGNEAFEIDEQLAAGAGASSTTNGFPGLNGYLYLSQEATVGPDDDDEGAEPTPAGTVLECMGSVRSRLTPRPASLRSDAHKNLTLAVRQRNMKKARIAEYVTQVDPEQEKLARIKNKDDLNKQAARKGRGLGRRSRAAPGMNRRYLEDDQDDEHYDSVNIRSLKRGAYMGDDDGMDDYGDDDDDEEDDAWSQRKVRGFQKGNRRPPPKEEDDESEEELVLGNESDEDEGVFRKGHGTNKRARAVVDEDD